MKKDSLRSGAKKLIETCLGLSKGEEVVIFCDKARIDLANACVEAISNCKAYSSVFLVTEAARPIQKLNEVMRRAMEEADVALIMLSHLHTETKFRRQILTYTKIRPCRVANMPGIERRHLENYLDLNYEKLVADSERIAVVLMKAEKAEVSTEAGTQIEVPLRGWSPPLAEAETGLLNEPNIWGNLPAGEAFVIPRLRVAHGKIVVNGSIPNCKIEEPLTITVEKGRAIDIQPKKCKEYRQLYQSFKDGGRNSTILVELGIGVNEQIDSITGSVIADEKMKETVHFGFGSNSGFGGTIRAGNHDDLIVLEPTVLLDGVPLMEKGHFSDSFVFQENYKATSPLNVPLSTKIARNEGVRCMEIDGFLYRYWKGCLGFKHMTMIGDKDTSKIARRIWYNIGVFKPYSRTAHELADLLRVNDETILRVLTVMKKYRLIS